MDNRLVQCRKPSVGVYGLGPWYRVASQRDLLALDNGIQKNVVDPRGLKMAFAIQGGNVI